MPVSSHDAGRYAPAEASADTRGRIDAAPICRRLPLGRDAQHRRELLRDGSRGNPSTELDDAYHLGVYVHVGRKHPSEKSEGTSTFRETFTVTYPLITADFSGVTSACTPQQHSKGLVKSCVLIRQYRALSSVTTARTGGLPVVFVSTTTGEGDMRTDQRRHSESPLSASSNSIHSVSLITYCNQIFRGSRTTGGAAECPPQAQLPAVSTRAARSHSPILAVAASSLLIYCAHRLRSREGFSKPSVNNGHTNIRTKVNSSNVSSNHVVPVGGESMELGKAALIKHSESIDPQASLGAECSVVHVERNRVHSLETLHEFVDRDLEDCRDGGSLLRGRDTCPGLNEADDTGFDANNPPEVGLEKSIQSAPVRGESLVAWNDDEFVHRRLHPKFRCDFEQLVDLGYRYTGLPVPDGRHANAGHTREVTDFDTRRLLRVVCAAKGEEFPWLKPSDDVPTHPTPSRTYQFFSGHDASPAVTCLLSDVFVRRLIRNKYSALTVTQLNEEVAERFGSRTCSSKRGTEMTAKTM